LETMEFITIQLIVAETRTAWVAWDVNGYWEGEFLDTDEDIALIQTGQKLSTQVLLKHQQHGLVKNFLSSCQKQPTQFQPSHIHSL